MASRARRRNLQLYDSDLDTEEIPIPRINSQETGAAAEAPPPELHSTFMQSVEECLNRRGVRPRSHWLVSCLHELSAVHTGFERLETSKQAELCFAQFLMADMNLAGAASLPPSVHTLHATEVPGPFVLQVDEITDIGNTLRDRYQERPAAPGRCLKLSMTDGVQHVFGIEYRPIRALQVLSPAGMKISLRDVHVRRGLLMLVPEILEVLGGVVDLLESARQRAVQRINKPPRGKRTPQGSVEQTLTQSATAAAWPNDSPTTPEAATHPNNTAQDRFENLNRSSTLGVPQPDRRPPPHQAEQDQCQPVTEQGLDSQQHRQSATQVHGQSPSTETSTEDHGQQLSTPAFSRLSLRSRRSTQNMNVDAEHPSSEHHLGSTAAGTQSAMDLDGENTPSASGALPVNIFIPFTYLAFLKEKSRLHNSSVQGRVKCVITGVKNFQYKDTDQFKLIVHIEDGSLCTECLFCHQLVEELVGYSPREVMSALTGKHKSQEVKDNMKNLEAFLTRFEGLMDVEFTQSSPIPTVLKAIEGVQSLDIKALLHRVDRMLPTQLDIKIIEISP